MALPIIPIALGGVALLLLATQSKASSYTQAPADGSKPPVKEPAPPGKSWKEMPVSLQEQVAAALGALGVSPATGELSGTAVTADAIKMATQTAALCESQGFYEVAKELRRHAGKAVVSVPTPPEAEPMKAAAPPGLTPQQIEALVRTLTLDRDPASIRALLASLERLPPTPQRDYYIQMAQALLLQLAAAQSTTQTMQQIDEVIRSPGIAEVHAAVQPLPPVAIPKVDPPRPPPQVPVLAPPPSAAKAPAAPKPEPIVLDRPVSITHANMKPLTGTRVLKLVTPTNMKGTDVGAWQHILRLDGYSSVTVDNIFGPKTKSATVDWQKSRGLTGDGQVGPATRAKIGSGPIPKAVVAPAPAITPQPAVPSAQKLVFANVVDPTPSAALLKKGMKGDAVRSWQNILGALGYGALVGTVDGDFGGKTDTATRALQQYAKDHYRDSKPITVDGAVGSQARRIVVARTAELKGVVVSGRYAA